jgi:hypothetical protein
VIALAITFSLIQHLIVQCHSFPFFFDLYLGLLAKHQYFILIVELIFLNPEAVRYRLKNEVIAGKALFYFVVQNDWM